MSLIVLGTVALDNVRTPVGKRRNLLGGSASHFAMGARLFTPVEISAVIGSDFPRKYLNFLRKKGINLEALIIRPGKTFQWDGEYKEEDLNTALTLNTELGVLTGFIPVLTKRQKKIPYVFLANYDPDIQFQLLQLMVRPSFIGLDTMNLWIMNKRRSLLRLMKHANLFVVNDGEARMLTGKGNLIKAVKELHHKGPEIIVVKKGEHGVIVYCERFMFSIPAYPIEKVVDPTGAGDTFAGGLMGWLAKVKRINEKSLKEAVLHATTVACFNVEGFGLSKTANLTLSQVHQRMRQLIKYIRI